MKRNTFIRHMATLGGIPFAPGLPDLSANASERLRGLKTSLNAYSFHGPLTKGAMSLDDLLEFTSQQGFDAIDITGYYFKGYPNAPSDDAIFMFKRRAHALGLAISGTGIRTDFTNPDSSMRLRDVELIKKWIPVAAKLGAPVLRIFAA